MSSMSPRNSSEQVAGLLLVVHWAIWMATIPHLLQTELDFHRVLILNLFSVGITAISIGYFKRSGHLFALSLPLQVIAAYGFLYNYCASTVYVFNGNWPEYVLSVYHLALVSSFFLCDIYVSFNCTKAFLQKPKNNKEILRRSPSASFITPFSERLGSPPNTEELETPRCRGASASSIEDVFADYEAVDAVTLA